MKPKMIGAHPAADVRHDGFVKKRPEHPPSCLDVNRAATRSLEKRGVYTVSRSESYVWEEGKASR